jgi:hypothetical protein
MTNLQWAELLEDPKAAISQSDRYLFAAIIRQQEAKIVDLQSRERSLRAAHNVLEDELEGIAKTLRQTR